MEKRRRKKIKMVWIIWIETIYYRIISYDLERKVISALYSLGHDDEFSLQERKILPSKAYVCIIRRDQRNISIEIQHLNMNNMEYQKIYKKMKEHKNSTKNHGEKEKNEEKKEIALRGFDPRTEELLVMSS